MRWSMPHFSARGAHRGALTIKDLPKFQRDEIDAPLANRTDEEGLL
jgi:hypothetical protein